MNKLIKKMSELYFSNKNRANINSSILMVVLFLMASLCFFQNISSLLITAGLIVLLIFSLSSFIKIENKKILFKANFEINNTFIILMIYVFYIFFSSKLIDTVQFSSNLINEMFIIIPMSFLLFFKYDKNSFIKISKYYTFLMFIFLIICILFNINNVNRGTMNIFGKSYDPNYLGLSFILPTVLSMFLIFKSSGKLRIFYLAFVILSLFFSLLSGSRGTTISLLSGITICFISRLFKDYKRIITKKNIIIFSLSALIIIIIFLLFIPTATLERFKIENMLSLGGRVDIWKKAISCFRNSSLKNMFLGNGIGSFRSIVAFYLYDYYHIAHNFIINGLIEIGLFGIIILVLLICNIIIDSIRKKNYFVLSLIVSTTLMYLTLDLSILFWIIVTLCTIILNDKNLNQYFCEG